MSETPKHNITGANEYKIYHGEIIYHCIIIQ